MRVYLLDSDLVSNYLFSKKLRRNFPKSELLVFTKADEFESVYHSGLFPPSLVILDLSFCHRNPIYYRQLFEKSLPPVLLFGIACKLPYKHLTGFKALFEKPINNTELEQMYANLLAQTVL
jgi:hypothetical protein